MNLIILGLRRSGTTIFWNTLRQDKTFKCFNEPFNPGIPNIVGENWDHLPNYLELRELFLTDPLRFWEKFSPISSMDELRQGLSDRQSEYFTWLLDRQNHNCFKITRAHFKIKALCDIAPNSVLVHLYRPPPSWVTSIMFPGWGLLNRVRPRSKRLLLKQKRLIRFALTRLTFWNKMSNYGGFDYETIIGRSPNSLFGHRLLEIGLNPDGIYEMPAVGRLLAYWRICYDVVEREGQRYFSDKFVSVLFDDFCARPDAVLKKIYRIIDRSLPQFEYSAIHDAHGPYSAQATQWHDYMAALRLPDI